MCLDCFLTFFNFTNDSVIEIMSSKGAELFFPVVCLFLGDMMELLTAARVRSANFARLLAACYICEVAGCQLGQHIHSPLRSLDESNQVITAALTAYQSGVGIGVANDNLKRLSLLPVEVHFEIYVHRICGVFIFYCYVEWLCWAELHFFSSWQSPL